MQECDVLPFGAEAGPFVYEANPCFATPGQGGIEVLHRKTDVVNSRPAFRDEPANGRFIESRLQELDERFTRGESGDMSAICIIERHYLHAKDVAIEREERVHAPHGDADVGDAGSGSARFGHV